MSDSPSIHVRQPHDVETDLAVLQSLVAVSAGAQITPAGMQEFITALAAIGCTKDEIATALSMDEASLELEFGDLIKRGLAVGKVSLRRAQFRSALSGNPQMLKHLGENVLDQRGRTELSTPPGRPFEISETLDPRITLREKLALMSTRSKPQVEDVDDGE